MVRTAVLTMAVLALTVVGDAQVAARQSNQKKRIAEGAINGELTKEETKKLAAEQGRIKRQTRRDRIDGGGLSAAERAKANRKQNRASDHIYNEKTDSEKK